MKNIDTPIFYDPKGKRSTRLRLTTLLILGAAAISLAVFLISVMLVNPTLPKLNIRASAATNENKPNETPDWLNKNESDKEKQKSSVVKNENKTKEIVNDSAAVTAINQPANPIAVGFYVNWDDTSYSSLKRNVQQLDWLVPEWIRLQAGDDPLALDYDDKALELVQKEKPDIKILPLVQNYKDEEWNSDLLAQAIKDETARQKLINSLLGTVADKHFGGVTIDLEEVPKSSQANLFRFMTELHDEFQKRNLIVAQAVPFDNPDWNYQAYAKTSDYLMLMAYDQHWSTSAPGAIAAQNWFEQTLAKRMRELDAAKTIVCFGNYGYEWADNRKEAPEVSFQEAVLAARDSEAAIRFDAATRNPYFSFQEDDGSHHTIWFLDAATAFNELKYSRQFHPFGFALWRLGSEDPTIWNFFGADVRNNASAEDLKTIRFDYDVDFEGTGEILQVTAEPQDGKRELATSEDGTIKNEIYTQVPSSYVIQRTGDRPGLVALTFDDGPDEVWTPKILDILKQENVSASFFIVGENAVTNPDLVKRIVAEGHDIGNHSFTHPNMGEIPAAVTEVELNATQRLIESLTGRSTILMRPPYFGDAEPRTADEVEPIVTGKKLGYITVGLHVDPDDWAQPGADVIREKTIEGVTNNSDDSDQRGQIVLLHDAGGDRSQTVAALPQIIHDLRDKGYRFVTVSELANLPQAQTMPFVPNQQEVLVKSDAYVFKLFSWAGWIFGVLFLTAIVLGVARVVITGALAILARRNQKTLAPNSNFAPFVSIIIPAFNEEKVIARTIHSLLGSDYNNFEILVVDDGSADATSAVVAENFADDSRVRLYTKENAGKGAALEFGFLHSRGEIVIGLDADTIFAHNTISALVREFQDERVGAVAGNAKVGNRINIVTRWQALEYITSQNLDRRVFAWLNAITVVPGAVGAWRRDALEKADGFGSNTLAEDQDLTLRVRRLGYRIAYADDAVAWTEAPDTLKGLRKQRFRWSYGTLQCLWKHRAALFNPKYGALGFVAMPSVWLFQIFFQLIAPLADAMMIWTLISHVLERLEHPHEFDASKLEKMLFYYLLFLAVDLAAAALAYAFERKEQKSLLFWLLLQRFAYRQTMYFVMVKSVITALSGTIVGWGKLERKATVKTLEI